LKIHDGRYKIIESISSNNSTKISKRILVARNNSFTNRFVEFQAIINNISSNKNDIFKDWSNLYYSYRKNYLYKLIILFIKLISIIFIIFNPYLVRFLGNFLIVNHADLNSSNLVLFIGNGDTNYVNYSYQVLESESVKLIKEVGIEKIFISSGKGKEYSEAEVVTALFVSNNISRDSIFKVNKITQSTYENVFYSNSILMDQNITNIIFKTSPLHSLRSYLVWKKINPNLDVYVNSSDFNYYNNDSNYFYSIINSWKIITYEYSAILFYKFKGVL
jgi:uncharacterized SAM-binding protein YcdF (DUF218 family)